MHFDGVADPSSEAGFRLDVGMLDERGLEGALGHHRGAGERRFGVALAHQAADQDVVGPIGEQPRRARRQRRVDVGQRRQRLPS